MLTGFVGELEVPENPTSWVDPNEWKGVYRSFHGMNLLGGSFAGIDTFFAENYDSFKGFYDTAEAHRSPLPEPWESRLN